MMQQTIPSVRMDAGPASASADPVVRVRDLTVWYHTDRGPLQVLDAIDLTIGHGEVVGLVGESGCGKTTLGRAILGNLPKPAADVRSGEVFFRGRDTRRLSEEEVRRDIRGRAITIVPQDPFGSFNPLFKVGTQIDDIMKWKSPRRAAGARSALPLLAPYPRARREADRADVLKMLADVQIPNPAQVLEKLPGELSGGQRQRLMIAMALLPGPEVIVADEPTTALDVTIQAQILKLMYRLVRDRGVSVLFTTHDLGVASELCDRIMVMYAGQEVETAPVSIFFRNPLHPYSAKLLESLPKAGGELRDIPGEIPVLTDPPQGCRFQTRCERATAACRTRPPAVEAAPGHVVRCHHPIERLAA